MIHVVADNDMPEIENELVPAPEPSSRSEPAAFGLGSIVTWNKPIGDAETLTLVAIVNGNWPDGQVSLFVFHFDGQYLARIVPTDQLTLVCSDSDLLRLPEILRRLEDLENAFMLAASPGPGAPKRKEK